ncbi:MAG: LPS export ABC transporter periplasmic protein LptC [Alphaproteobacteria bacterium]|nr:LPS export ABC transporter periplasmic protein LptC [Alphaproteobacteria bacterium]
MEKYSQFVKRAKLILPFLAFFVIILLLLYPQFKEVGEEVLLKIPKIDSKNPTLFTIEGARFFATDEQGRPFSLEVKKAVEKDSSESEIFFENIEGELKINMQSWAVFEAQRGHFDQKNKKMILFDSVSFMTNSGYYLDGQEMTIFVKNMTAESNLPITIHGDFGQIESQGFTYSEKGILNFKGPIHAHINKGQH